MTPEDYADQGRGRVTSPYDLRLRPKRADIEERFLRHLILGDGDHWMWGAHVDPTTGYGKIGAGGKRGGHLYAHRVAYELYVGLIPEGLQIDHLCRVRACVRPAHLEPVTQLENVQRWSRTILQCRQGHVYDEANTKYRPNGHRYCRECNRLRAVGRRDDGR